MVKILDRYIQTAVENKGTFRSLGTLFLLAAAVTAVVATIIFIGWGAPQSFAGMFGNVYGGPAGISVAFALATVAALLIAPTFAHPSKIKDLPLSTTPPKKEPVQEEGDQADEYQSEQVLTSKKGTTCRDPNDVDHHDNNGADGGGVIEKQNNPLPPADRGDLNGKPVVKIETPKDLLGHENPDDVITEQPIPTLNRVKRQVSAFEAISRLEEQAQTEKNKALVAEKADEVEAAGALLNKKMDTRFNSLEERFNRLVEEAEEVAKRIDAAAKNLEEKKEEEKNGETPIPGTEQPAPVAPDSTQTQSTTTTITSPELQAMVNTENPPPVPGSTTTTSEKPIKEKKPKKDQSLTETLLQAPSIPNELQNADPNRPINELLNDTKEQKAQNIRNAVADSIVLEEEEEKLGNSWGVDRFEPKKEEPKPIISQGMVSEASFATRITAAMTENKDLSKSVNMNGSFVTPETEWNEQSPGQED